MSDPRAGLGDNSECREAEASTGLPSAGHLLLPGPEAGLPLAPSGGSGRFGRPPCCSPCDFRSVLTASMHAHGREPCTWPCCLLDRLCGAVSCPHPPCPGPMAALHRGTPVTVNDPILMTALLEPTVCARVPVCHMCCGVSTTGVAPRCSAPVTSTSHRVPRAPGLLSRGVRLP